MLNTETSDTAPRYHVVRTDYKHYELWVADRIATFDNRSDLERWVKLLKEHHTPI